MPGPTTTLAGARSVDVSEDVSDDELARWLAPRTDLVEEAPAVVGVDGADGDGTTYRFAMSRGPFADYERIVVVHRVATSAGGSRASEPHGHRVAQTTRYRLEIGWWRFLFALPVKSLLRRPGGRTPWWAPPEVLDAQGAASLASLGFLSLVAGYLGTLITQTLTFAADEFGAAERAQGDTLAAVRIGVFVAMGVAAWADRHGRRRAMLWCAGGAVVMAASGAVAPNLWVLGATQLVARGLATALGLLIVVVVAEEMPAGSRAYGVSLLTMTGALGAGQVLWLLPLADLDERAWRILFVFPLVYLPLIVLIARLLPESRRFVRRHASAHFGGHWGRLALLASTSLLLAAFSSPASQLQNEYLREEFGFSAATITLFTMITVTPGSIGIVVGGRLADQRGKRLIGGIGIAGGTLFTVSQYVTDAAPVLWASSAVGSVLGGLAVPALAVYGPELFPTSLRAKANVITTTVGVVGSVVGLLVVGRLAERWSLGPAIACMSIGPALVVMFLIPRYPETAHRELEDINPEDALAVAPPGLL